MGSDVVFQIARLFKHCLTTRILTSEDLLPSFRDRIIDKNLLLPIIYVVADYWRLRDIWESDVFQLRFSWISLEHGLSRLMFRFLNFWILIHAFILNLSQLFNYFVKFFYLLDIKLLTLIILRILDLRSQSLIFESLGIVQRMNRIAFYYLSQTAWI
jgi:hypothetical protein